MSRPLVGICGDCGRKAIEPSYSGTASVPTANQDGECIYCGNKIFEKTELWKVRGRRVREI